MNKKMLGALQARIRALADIELLDPPTFTAQHRRIAEQNGVIEEIDEVFAAANRNADAEWQAASAALKWLDTPARRRNRNLKSLRSVLEQRSAFFFAVQTLAQAINTIEHPYCAPYVCFKRASTSTPEKAA